MIVSIELLLPKLDVTPRLPVFERLKTLVSSCELTFSERSDATFSRLVVVGSWVSLLGILKEDGDIAVRDVVFGDFGDE